MFSGYANMFIYQVEVHDVGKEMELDLIKQYSQVDCWYTLLIIPSHTV